MTTLLDCLTRARELVSNGWVQHNSVKIIEGKSHFCMTGACFRASIEVSKTIFNDALGDRAVLALQQSLGQGSVVSYNDTTGRTKAEVLAVFDKAIEREKANAQTI